MEYIPKASTKPEENFWGCKRAATDRKWAKMRSKGVYLGVHRVYLGVHSPGGTLHIGHIDPMIEQKNEGIGSFFGVKIGKIPVFMVIFLGSVNKN